MRFYFSESGNATLVQWKNNTGLGCGLPVRIPFELFPGSHYQPDNNIASHLQ